MSRGLSDRSFWLRMALLALALVALSSRLIIPAGYMPGAGKSMQLTLCTGSGPAMIQLDIDKDHHPDEGKASHAPCAFAGTAAPLLSAAPPVLLAAAIVYVFVHGFDPAPPLSVARPARLRPPLRGPPTL